MSGYGVPQPSPRTAGRARRSGPALPVLDVVGLGLALLAFVVAFLPWAEPAAGRTVQGWDLPVPTVATVLLVIAAVLLVAPLLDRPPVPAEDDAAAPASPLPAVLAVLAALLLLVHALTSGEILGVEVDRGIGVWLGLVVGVGAAAVLVLSWLQRTGRIRKRPAGRPASTTELGLPGQWGQQSPPTWGQPQPYGQPAPSGYPAQLGQHPQQPAGYGQGGYGQPTGYPSAGQPASGPPTGGQPAQAPYGQEQYPGYSGQGYPQG